MFAFPSHLAEQYGSDVAADILARSRANTHLDASPYTSGNFGADGTYITSHGRYDSLGVRAPGGL
jgi:hypothetical protein